MVAPGKEVIPVQVPCYFDRFGTPRRLAALKMLAFYEDKKISATDLLTSEKKKAKKREEYEKKMSEGAA